MDFFVSTIPFLLAMAVFTPITLISLPLPKVAQTEAEIQSVEKDKFMLRVYVVDDKTKNQVRTEKGFVVDCSCLKEPKFLPLTKEGKYDQIALNEIMLGIKKKNEQSRSLILIPGHYVPFTDMVLTLDATRETLPSIVPGEKQYELFPEVILEEVDT